MRVGIRRSMYTPYYHTNQPRTVFSEKKKEIHTNTEYYVLVHGPASSASASVSAASRT